MRSLRDGGGVGIDAELLVRRHDSKPTRQLSEAWMRAYLRGGDRDQPAFSYAFDKAAMAPCRRAAAGDKAGDKAGGKGDKGGDEGCGLRCGQGFVNLVGHAASNDCAADGGEAREVSPAASSSDFDRPAWSAAPPAWLCRAGSLAADAAAAAAAAAAGARTSSMLGHGAHATP